MEDAKKKTIRDKLRHQWLIVWNYYQRLKIRHNLTAYDILRQLNMRCTYTNLEYLSSNGKDYIPACGKGTGGRIVWDGLLIGLKKIYWLPAVNLTYEEKYYEMRSNSYFTQYDIDFIDNLQPKINVCINHQEYYNGPYNHDKDDIIRTLTIDGIIPEIIDISHSYWI